MYKDGDAVICLLSDGDQFEETAQKVEMRVSNLQETPATALMDGPASEVLTDMLNLMESSYKLAGGLDPDELDSQSLWLCLQCLRMSSRGIQRERKGRSRVAPAPGSRPLYLVLMRSMVSCTWLAVATAARI